MLINLSIVIFERHFLNALCSNINTRYDKFFNKLNKIIDCKGLEQEINKEYKKGESADGRPAYSGILLFKMLLMGI